MVPLALLPIEVPPEDTVYQLIVFPEDVALRSLLLPIQMLAGVAVTFVGVAGKGFTVTVVEPPAVNPFEAVTVT